MIYNINCTKIDNFLSIPNYPHPFSKTALFHCISTGHYFRNSLISELSILHQNESGIWIKRIWTSEKESDEYDMLEYFSRSLEPFTFLIGFNSTSFHIPYLEQKLKAYGLPSPFSGKSHLDLLKEIRPIGKHLHISTKLNDLRIFLKLPDELSEIECIASAAMLFQYEEILKGNFSIKKTEMLDGDLLISCQTNQAFPADIRIHNDEFYLIGSGNDLKIKVKFIQNRLKLYYNNYKDYYYLPEEDIVVHKSLADTIHKDKKIRATAENCFTYIECSEHLMSNPVTLKKYLAALLQHYMNDRVGGKIK